MQPSESVNTFEIMPVRKAVLLAPQLLHVVAISARRQGSHFEISTGVESDGDGEGGSLTLAPTGNHQRNPYSRAFDVSITTRTPLFF